MPFYFGKQNSHLEQLFYNVSLTGAFPYYLTFELEGNRQSLLRQLKTLQDGRYAEIEGNGKHKHIYLTRKGNQILEEYYPQWVPHYDFMTNNRRRRYEITKKIRQFRRADVIVFLRDTNVRFVTDQIEELRYLKKPELTYENPKTNPEYLEGHYPSYPLDQKTPSLFYFSNEIKGTSPYVSKDIQQTNFIGAMLSNGGVYVFYSAYFGVLSMMKQGEGKAPHKTRDVFQRSFSMDTNTREDFMRQKNNAIIIVKDFESLYRLVLEEDEESKQKTKVAYSKRVELNSAERSFNSIHGLTLDTLGRNILQMLTAEEWRYLLGVILFGGENLATESSIHDSLIRRKDKDTMAIEFVSQDMKKFQHFLNVSFRNQRDDIEYEVHALTEQIPMLKKAIKDYDAPVKIVEISENKRQTIKEAFLSNNESLLKNIF